MIHTSNFKSRDWESLYNSLLREIASNGFFLSSCPPDPEFLNWLKYDKGFSYQGSIHLGIVNLEDLGTVWRITISSKSEASEFFQIDCGN
jgi:hypothetical protein